MELAKTIEKTKAKPRAKPKYRVPHYMLDIRTIYAYEERHEPAYVVYEYLENQRAKRKAPTMAQIRRQIPFVMNRRMEVASKALLVDPNYVTTQKLLFGIQEPGKLEALIDQMIKDGILRQVDGAILE